MRQAELYEKRQEAAGYPDNTDYSKMPEYNAKLEALLPVIRKELPLKAHVHRADDIFTAIRIAKEFDLNLKLDHVTDGSLIADELAKEGYSLAVGPSFGYATKYEFTKEVFEEFAQEDSDVRTQYHGVGLGMAIVKKYVDMMGGTISVQSKKHEGTTFTVDIPLEITDKECNKSDTGFSEKVNLTGVNVLLAEDNELNAEIATVQLEEFGMNVERAVDGKNAVEIFRNHPEGTFDVILMDIMMPEMNGYEAVKVIRAMNDRPDGKNIPIIAMTANSFAEDVQASLDAGMNAHLSKPIVIDEVIKTILRYVDTSTFGTRNK